MIDTHAHINAEAFDEDRNEVIIQAFESGVEAIIIPAIEPEKFGSVLSLTEKYDKIYCGIGIHPHNANEVNDDTLQLIEEKSKSNKVVAIGEIGLDYYYDFAPKDVQKYAFAEQIKIAKKLNLPIIVHNRESDEDLLKLLENQQDGTLRGVLHCFSSDVNTLQRALKLGFLVSFTGNITFKKSVLSEVVKHAPLDKIMIETDSPYMTPVPYRGKRNQPSFVRMVAEKISEIKEISFQEVIQMTTNNAKNLFKILTVFIFTLFLSQIVLAQDYDAFDEEYYEEEEETEKEVWVNPYKKFLGLGVVIGTNTIVQTYSDDGTDISYEGIFAVGGALSYELFDFMNLSASYLYSKNTKIQEDYEEIPNVYNLHQMFELTATFTPNAGNKINFFGGAGPTILLNEYFQGIDDILKTTDIGINTTVGFTFNQKIGNAGILTFNAEWKLNFIFGETQFSNDPREDKIGAVNVSSFFSIPRATLSFYPNF